MVNDFLFISFPMFNYEVKFIQFIQVYQFGSLTCIDFFTKIIRHQLNSL